MEKSKKGVTPSVEVEKPNPSMDIRGFGKDFLTSWKLTEEKNGLNFTNETPQKEKKKVFDFAKLDDFELGDDFAKISSFKMDISDIDFSSPECATDEPKEKTKGQSTPRKINSEKDDFSFNFDFNELEGFGLESNLLKVGNNSETKKVLDLSSKKEEKIDSGRKPGIIDPNMAVISKNLAESNKTSNSESRFVGIQCSMFKETSTEKNREAKGNESGEPKKQFQLSGIKNVCTKTFPGGRQKKQFETANSEKLCVNSGSETSTSLLGNIIVPEACDNSPSEEQNDPEKSNNTGSRGSGSTLHELDFECSSKACIEKSECDAKDRSKTKLQSNIARRSKIKMLGEEKTAMEGSQLQGSSSTAGVSGKLNHASKINAQNQVSHSLLSSSSKAPIIENWEPKNLRGNALKLNAKEIAMQLKSTFKSGAAGSIHSPLSLSKAVRAFSDLKTEKLTSCSADEKRVSCNNDQGTLPSICISKPSGGKVQEQLLLGTRNDEAQEDNTLVHDQSFGVPEEGSSYITKQTGTPKAGFTNNMLLKISSVEKHESCVNDGEKCLEAKIMPGLKESNSNLIGGKQGSYQAGNCDSKPFSLSEEGRSDSTKHIGTPKDGFTNNRLLKIISLEKHESCVNVDEKSVETKMIIPGLKESNSSSTGGKPESYQAGNSNLKSEMPATLTPSPSTSGKKCSPLNSPLKRKSVEAPNMEVFSLNPLKRLSGSMFPRRMLVATPVSDDQQNLKQTINEREVLRDSNEEPYSKDLSVGTKPSTCATPSQHVKDKEETTLLESEKYRKKAESYAKELDDICTILKKKNEEAKELLVHAVVNNNLLMMLNHPRQDEKTRSLQRFANTLLAKKYED